MINSDHSYPPDYAPGTHWALDEAWKILDLLRPGVIPDDIRYLLAGSICAALISERKRPTELADNDNIRSMGCSECGTKLRLGTPFVHHESSGSWGGPWCMRCAVEKFGFGSADLKGNFYYHSPEEP